MEVEREEILKGTWYRTSCLSIINDAFKTIGSANEHISTIWQRLYIL